MMSRLFYWWVILATPFVLWAFWWETAPGPVYIAAHIFISFVWVYMFGEAIHTLVEKSDDYLRYGPLPEINKWMARQTTTSEDITRVLMGAQSANLQTHGLHYVSGASDTFSFATLRHGCTEDEQRTQNPDSHLT